MSDNVTPIFETEEQPKKKLSIKKKWIVFVSIVVLILVILIWFLFSNSTALDGIKRFFRYLGVDEDDYGSVRFDSYGNCSYSMVDDTFAVSSQSGLTLFSEGGSELATLSGSLSNPMLDCADDKVLLYDVGGTRLALLNTEGDTLFDLTVSGTIFDADVCEDGLCAVIYEGSDCYAVLDVYNEKGAKLYTHRSQSAFLNTCALSDDGAYAVVTALGQDDLSFQSSARILTTGKEGIKSNISFGAQVICDIAFLADETFCAVGEESLFFFDTDGKLLKEYRQEQAQLAGYRFAPGKVLALYDRYDLSLGYQLCCLDAEGAVSAALDLEAAPLYMSVCDRYVCLTDSQNILIYDDSLKLRYSTENNAYTAALARSDGTAVCIGDGFAELYIP